LIIEKKTERIDDFPSIFLYDLFDALIGCDKKGIITFLMVNRFKVDGVEPW
jgi:hypothetical protein